MALLRPISRVVEGSCFDCVDLHRQGHVSATHRCDHEQSRLHHLWHDRVAAAPPFPTHGVAAAERCSICRNRQGLLEAFQSSAHEKHITVLLAVQSAQTPESGRVGPVGIAALQCAEPRDVGCGSNLGPRGISEGPSHVPCLPDDAFSSGHRYRVDELGASERLAK